jgi:hypothetical protein
VRVPRGKPLDGPLCPQRLVEPRESGVELRVAGGRRVDDGEPRPGSVAVGRDPPAGGQVQEQRPADRTVEGRAVDDRTAGAGVEQQQDEVLGEGHDPV